jgi:hypothetical protein
LRGGVVKPGSGIVLALAPEFIRNEDGNKKQDCERNAAKRWLNGRKAKSEWRGATILGDDAATRQ